MQRTLRLRIRINHVENGGWMIDANIRVLPAGTARRHAESMALRVVTLVGEHTVQAVRPPQICVIDRDTLPRHTRNPAALLVNIPPICRIDHIPACSNGNRPFPHRFRAVDTTNQPPSVRLTILYIPSATLRELPLAESRRADHHRSNAVPNVRTRAPDQQSPHGAPGGRVAGGPHRADLLSAPYLGIVVAATIRIAPRPASTPNVELVTP
ncbi:hypothetical protein LGN17_17145 [Burkholderia sp. AU30280]|uniref:hypothetical protein n=1 Tax=Burkholderia sp. AU30280 TaxID=2879628 RepID=UPI001CF1C29B|nr:hypothetical protein [Burkholderia sp. AU30280]MCA8274220.1 hypothetical protein [Burkholderia sp. AU30280]